MIRQPLGWILVPAVAVLAIAISAGSFWCASVLLRLGVITWGVGTWVPLLVSSLVPFSLLLEVGHRLEIRLFFRRRGVRVQKIRGFKNHYRVYYLHGGKTMSGKWPSDFQSWALPRSS